MSRRPDPPREPTPPRGLSHQPFAALRGGAPAPSTPPTPTPEPATAPTASTPAGGRVVVRRERKGHGGKTVTIAAGSGLETTDVAVLAREAARALGAGARAEDGALVVQGDQADRLVAWLSARGFGPVTRGN